MNNIKITITNKRCTVQGSPVIVCGNSDYSIDFTFDAEWAGAAAKTARFVYVQEGAVKYQDVVFTGSGVEVPVLSNTREVRVGVFTGDLQTTTPARIPCERSILCGTGVPADPTPDQYDQIMELLGSSVDYYHTAREELGVSHESLNADYIFGLYDALMAEYPDGRVRKKEHTSNDGTFTNYEYVISTGEYSTEGIYAEAYGADPHIKKPKYLVLSGIHGTERKTTLSTYRFIRDVLSGHNVPPAFREGATISVMPIGTPSAFNAFTRQSDEAVDINRNFKWNWEADTRKDENGNSFTYGDSAGSEKETQAIVHWLAENADAELFIDFHNSGAMNEKVVVMGVPDDSTADTAKRVALRGVDRIIPFWKDVIGYPDKVVASNRGEVAERDVLFSYCASVEGGGMAFAYAYNVLGIRSIAIETCVYYGDHYEYTANETSYQPEVIAMGAEALGNILIEFYAQSCEVITMSNIDNKLDALLGQVNSGFSCVSGSFTLDADDGNATTVAAIRTLPGIPGGAKLVVFEADTDTLAMIKGLSGYFVTGGALQFTPQAQNADNRCGYTSLWANSKNNYTASVAYNDGGISFSGYTLKAGTYNWTAYYWNE